MNTPLISIIMPVYNAEKYLQKAINSILNQTYQNFEFIIINDGSTDRSTDIINSVNDKRVVKIYQKNTGYVRALNYGISISKGEWIARMDADDISYSNRLEVQLSYINNEIAVIGSQAEIIDEIGKINGTTSFKVIHEEIVTELLNHNSTLIHPSVIVNKSKVLLVGGYDEKMLPSEDYDLWLRISKTGKIINVNKSLLALRKHENNISKIKLESAINNGFISLAYYYHSKSFQPMTQNEYDYFKVKTKSITKFYKKRLIKFEDQKKIFNNSTSILKYLYPILNLSFPNNYIIIILLKKWILYKIKTIKQ